MRNHMLNLVVGVACIIMTCTEFIDGRPGSGASGVMFFLIGCANLLLWADRPRQNNKPCTCHPRLPGVTSGEDHALQGRDAGSDRRCGER